MDLIVQVKQVKGSCPVYKKGDSFMLKEGYRLVSDIPVCMHGLSAVMPFYNALRFCEPAQLGIDEKNDKSKACIQCPDNVECTGGGTVVFEISKTG